MNLQEIIDRGMAFDVVPLPFGEFEGPFYIRKPCTIYGNTTTIWSRKGPALIVESTGVTLARLRLESLEGQRGTPDYRVLVAKHADTTCQEVEIVGDVQGIAGEEGDWQIPKVLSLGHIPANEKNEFVLEVSVPVPVRLSTEIAGLAISPEQLSAGRGRITLTFDPCRHGTFFYGEIKLTSQLIHTIYINALVNEAAAKPAAQLVYTPEAAVHEAPLCTQSLVLNCSLQPPQELAVYQAPPAINDYKAQEPLAQIEPAGADVSLLRRGERRTLTPEMCQALTLSLTYTERNEKMDIDPYVIMLDEQNKAHKDEDMIFFGNTRSACGSIQYDESRKEMHFELQRIPQAFHRLAIVYSIYGTQESDNFSKLAEVAVQLRAGGREQWRFVMEDLTIERTIVACELYRHNGGWKLNAIGAGYSAGLARLCQEYGLEIAQ